MKRENILEENFYGTATVGERGQIVIPADARKKMGINPGDKILVIGHPKNAGLLLCKIDAMKELFSSLLEDLSRIESKVDISSED